MKTNNQKKPQILVENEKWYTKNTPNSEKLNELTKLYYTNLAKLDKTDDNKLEELVKTEIAIISLAETSTEKLVAHQNTGNFIPLLDLLKTNDKNLKKTMIDLACRNYLAELAKINTTSTEPVPVRLLVRNETMRKLIDENTLTKPLTKIEKKALKFVLLKTTEQKSKALKLLNKELNDDEIEGIGNTELSAKKLIKIAKRCELTFNKQKPGKK